MQLSAKNCFIESAVWTGTLSWWRINDFSTVLAIFSYFLLALSKLPYNNAGSLFCLLDPIFPKLCPLCQNNNELGFKFVYFILDSIVVCQCIDLSFCLMIILENRGFITSDDFVKKVQVCLKLLQNIIANFLMLFIALMWEKSLV